MSGENPGDVKALWQRQQEEPQDVAIASVRRRALTIEATARRRSLVFRLSIVNNVAICAALAWLRPETRPFVAVFFLAVSLAQIEALTRSAPVTAPGDAGLMTSLAFLRASLERERAFAARAWLWFLLPAAIGGSALFAGMWATGGPGLRVALPLAASVLAIFAFVLVRSRQRGRLLQNRLDSSAKPRTHLIDRHAPAKVVSDGELGPSLSPSGRAT